jgi:hypothetical protein
VGEGKMLKGVEDDKESGVVIAGSLTANRIRFLPTVEMTRIDGRLWRSSLRFGLGKQRITLLMRYLPDLSSSFRGTGDITSNYTS